LQRMWQPTNIPLCCSNTQMAASSATLRPPPLFATVPPSKPPPPPTHLMRYSSSHSTALRSRWLVGSSSSSSVGWMYSARARLMRDTGRETEAGQRDSTQGTTGAVRTGQGSRQGMQWVTRQRTKASLRTSCYTTSAAQAVRHNARILSLLWCPAHRVRCRALPRGMTSDAAPHTATDPI